MKNTELNIINEIITYAREIGIGQLTTEDNHYDGKNITVKGKHMINFGSCSYLGLEVDQRLKEGAINAIQKYGVQFSSSRTYMSCTLYEEFEKLVSEIFSAPIVLSTSVSLGHHAVLPIVIEEGDAIIMDQQVHASVQDAVLKVKAKGIFTTIVRHNDLIELEKKIKELSITYNRIWYMIDGVYSMYGDFAPIKDLELLLNTYKKFHLYADDAHGFGWTGKNGSGYILSQIPLHQKIILATSLNKAFAAGGGAFVIPDKTLHEKVKNCGGAFIFSGPHQIAVLGAGIAATKIFLSDEIYTMQNLLAEKIQYCHDLLVSYNLPVVSNPSTPIFFIGLGLVRVGYNMVKRILDEGYYVNMSVFPAVPECCTGIRFTITLHHTKEDISNLVTNLAYHFPKALKQEGRSFADISRAFKKVTKFSEYKMDYNPKKLSPKYSVQHERSIDQLEQMLWDKLFIDQGIFNHKTLQILEKSFSNNLEPENNWSFHYFIISDEEGVPIIATFLTCALCKDDALAQKHVSKILESKRVHDPYFLTSKNLIMGCLVTEGDHLYINREFQEWKKALMLLLDEVWKVQDEEQATMLHLRDFHEDDAELYTFFKDQGFIPISMPETHVVQNIHWEDRDHYLQQLNSDKRYYMRKNVLPYEHLFQANVVKHPDNEKVKIYYNLYSTVAKRSLQLNNFILPIGFFMNLAASTDFEFIEMCWAATPEKIVGVSINYITKTRYNFILTGMDYNYVQNCNLYPNILWQIIKRSNELNIPLTLLGLTASQNKRKFNAKQIRKVGFLQMKDNFSLSLINAISKGGEAA